MAYHEAKYGEMGETGSLTGKAVATMHWRMARFEPFTKRISQLRPDIDPVQGYCDFLNFRYTTAVNRGHDTKNEVIFEEWIDAGTPGFDPAVTSQEPQPLP